MLDDGEGNAGFNTLMFLLLSSCCFQCDYYNTNTSVGTIEPFPILFGLS